jgi:hypothetical protein
MASLGKNRGPYSTDVQEVRHRNKTVTTILNSDVFDDLIQNLDEAYEYETGYVPVGYEHRPDLISNVFYGTPANWWLLMLVNGITDPSEGFQHNQRILIPKL